jgi:hypothetical protein
MNNALTRFCTTAIGALVSIVMIAPSCGHGVRTCAIRA